MLNLKIDDEQLQTEITERVQTFFEPDASEEIQGQELVKSYVKCIICQKIPLEILNCSSFFSVICKICLKQNQNSEKCPSEGCKKSAEKFEMIPMQKSVATK